MKCPSCYEEVSAERFCIYCGSPLRVEEEQDPQELDSSSHVSAVLRLKRRDSYSHTRLPVHKPQSPPMRLESLETLPHRESQEIDTQPPTTLDAQGSPGDTTMSQERDDKRQSRELEALLKKLNGGLTVPEPAFREDDLSTASSHDPSFDISIQEPISESQEWERNLSIGASLENDFFGEIEDEILSMDMSQESIPMGSGTFARTPSGGFVLLWESIKDRTSLWYTQAKDAVAQRNMKELKPYAVAALLLTLSLVLVLVIASKSGQDNASQEGDIMAASAQAMDVNEQQEPSYELIRLEDEGEVAFFEDDAQDVDLDFDVDAFDFGNVAEEPAPKKEEIKAGLNVSDEKRTFGRKDKVFVADLAPTSYTLKRSCIMREGPASRFKLIRELKSKEKVSILAESEEDWVLEAVNSHLVWTKSCAGCSSKLGPGVGFANALAGQSVPSPTGRVISSTGWRYVQAGDLFGYVGPACFK